VNFARGVCAELRKMPSDKFAQHLVDVTDAFLPTKVLQGVEHLWPNFKTVSGTFQHSFAKHVVNGYNETCKDWRYLPEGTYKDGTLMPKAGNLKDSTRVDLAFDPKGTREETKKDTGSRFGHNPGSVAYDFKFGEAGEPAHKIEKAKINLPPQMEQKIVRPTHKGGISEIKK
jgi:hypothetical protein